MMEVVFFVLLFSGILAFLASLGLTRVHWRPDIPPYGRRTRSLDVFLHPERYVKNGPLRAIRSLNLVGALLIAGAAGTTAYDILRTMLQP